MSWTESDPGSGDMEAVRTASGRLDSATRSLSGGVCEQLGRIGVVLVQYCGASGSVMTSSDSASLAGNAAVLASRRS